MALGRREKLRLVAAGTAAVMLATIVAGTLGAVSGTRTDGDGEADGAGEDPASPDADVILYGDSLSFEAAQAFQLYLASEDVEALMSPLPGSAICDLLDPIGLDMASIDPQVAVLQFTGNNTTPCTLDADGGRLTGQALADRYAADAEVATETLVSHGVQVVWVQPPPAPGLPGGATDLIDEAYVALVEDWESRAPGEVHYAPAGEAVSGPDGGFVETLPCLPDEAAELGCEDGEIRVRNEDRIHFCPEELGEDGCSATYSPGARRFAEAMADVVLPLL